MTLFFGVILSEGKAPYLAFLCRAVRSHPEESFLETHLRKKDS